MRFARKILFAVVGAGMFAAGAAPAVISFTASSTAPATSVAMYYDGGSGGPGMYYD